METLLSLGYWGLFLGSFLASTIVPFSADILLIGMLAAGGDMWVCLLVATAGNWLGGMTSYGLGYAGNLQRIEKWFHVSAKKMERWQQGVQHYGMWLALGAWLPIVGDVFAIALGFYRASVWVSGLWMLIGRFLRFLIWTLLYQGTFG